MLNLSLPTFKYFKPQQTLAYIALILLLYGFLFNRVVNNVGLLFAGIHALVYLKESYQVLWKPWFWSIISVILFPTLYDLLAHGQDYSDSKNLMKLGLIVYPLYFMSCLRYKNFLIHSSILFLFSMLFSSFYSVIEYLNSFDYYNKMYGTAKVLKVLAYSDHIRISWATSISIIIAAFLYKENKNSSLSLFLLGYILFQIIFIHILGAKTGLVVLYLSGFIWVIFLGRNFSKKYALAFLLFLFCLPVFAYLFVPSFQKRIEFIKHDFYYYSKGEYQDGLSDALRVYSIKGGADIIQSDGIFGVGFKNLKPVMNEWYETNTPFIKIEDRYPPSSEFLVYWASGGILGLLFFTAFILLPLFHPILRNNIFFLSFYLPSSVSFLFETHLDGQLPLFLFGFSMALFWSIAYTESSKV